MFPVGRVSKEKHTNKIFYGIQKKRKKDERGSKSYHIYSLKKQTLRTCARRKLGKNHIISPGKRVD